MFLADFHIHSNFSDGKHSIPEIVDYFGSRGFGAIGITDHLCEDSTFLGKASAYLGCTLIPATFPLYREILRSEKARAWDQYQMIVISGVELTKNSVSNHRSAHILSLGTEEYISAADSASVLIDKIHDLGGLAIAAHPVWTQKLEKQTFYLWSKRDELAEKFDAWEVASGPYIFDRVKQTQLPKIANSDLHHFKQMSSWKTVFHCERHEGAVLRAIRKQEVDFTFYKEALKRVHTYQPHSVSLDFRIPNYPMGNVAHT